MAVQPDGLDPCDLRLKEGDAAVRDLVASRLPLYEFAVRAAMSEYDLESAEGRIAALDGAARIVARIKDVALRKVYAVKVDRWLGLMDEDLVMKRIGEHIPGRSGGRDGTRSGLGPRDGGRSAPHRQDTGLVPPQGWAGPSATGGQGGAGSSRPGSGRAGSGSAGSGGAGAADPGPGGPGSGSSGSGSSVSGSSGSGSSGSGGAGAGRRWSATTRVTLSSTWNGRR